MHELSIARSLADFVCDQTADLDATRERVSVVRIRIGAMSGVVPQALRSAYRAAVAGTPLLSATLEMETVDLVIWCPKCGQERLLEDISQLCCPVCQARSSKIVQGKELEITSIEVIDATEDSSDSPANTQEK